MGVRPEPRMSKYTNTETLCRLVQKDGSIGEISHQIWFCTACFGITRPEGNRRKSNIMRDWGLGSN